MSKVALETARMSLRELTLHDAPFILELVNDPDWLRFIGDRNVHTLEQARDYIRRGPMAMYKRRCHGLWLMERSADAQPLGLCGLLAREALQDIDLGFALLPQFRRQGYAYESARACVGYAHATLQLQRIVAITTLDNMASAELLERLGFNFEATLRLPPDEATELRLFARSLPVDDSLMAHPCCAR